MSGCEKIQENDYHVSNTREGQTGAYCAGYLEGFSDAILGFSYEPAPFCFLPNYTIAQAILAFVTWAELNSNQLNKPAAFCVLVALGKAFPCSANK
jgi:Rap1a immunity proteins